MPQFTVAKPKAGPEPVPKIVHPESIREDIGYVKPEVAPVSPVLKPVLPLELIEAPREWTEKWNDEERAQWGRLNNRSRKTFIEHHSAPNLCGLCKEPVAYTPSPLTDCYFAEGKNHFPVRPTGHDECADRYYARKRTEAIPPKTWWEINCPPEFQKVVELSKLPDRRAFERVMAWLPAPDAKGIVCHGGTRAGKSRSVWQLLKLVSAAGKSVEAWTANDWGLELIKQFDELREVADWLKRMATVDVLLLDDIDKLTMTERVQAELFSVIDHRCSHGKPVFVTTQLVGCELADLFNAELGAALVARLREFCEAVPFVKTTQSRGDDPKESL